jgi:hypothetical protein
VPLASPKARDHAGCFAAAVPHLKIMVNQSFSEKSAGYDPAEIVAMCLSPGTFFPLGK